MTDLDDRFWTKVVDTGYCWVWTHALHDGYGRFHVTSRQEVPAHVWAYEQLRAEVPPELELDHECRNRACVNPWHLDPVTTRVNTVRGESAPGQNARKTHCVAGHEFTPENTFVRRSPGRLDARGCRACRAARDRRRHASGGRFVCDHCELSYSTAIGLEVHARVHDLAATP